MESGQSPPPTPGGGLIVKVDVRGLSDLHTDLINIQRSLSSIFTALGGLKITGAVQVGPLVWTPTDNSGASLVFTAVDCFYQQIGNMWFVYGSFTYPSTVDGSDASIAGLPLTIPNFNHATAPAIVESGATGVVLIQPNKNAATAKFISTADAPVINSTLSGKTVVFMLTIPAS